MADPLPPVAAAEPPPEVLVHPPAKPPIKKRTVAAVAGVAVTVGIIVAKSVFGIDVCAALGTFGMHADACGVVTAP